MRRNPDSRPNNVPLSIPTYAPAIRDEADGVAYESGSTWSPYGTFFAHPFFGGYDPLSLTDHGVMHVEQADLYDASPNPWPNNAQFDRPNSIGITVSMMRLAPHTSAHPGAMMPTGGGPSMLFRAPPVFGLQQKPIPAVGV